MLLALASFGLADWGQLAAIILALSLFVSIIVGLALTLALMFGFAWVREKAELIKILRPFVNVLNSGLDASKEGAPLPLEAKENKVVERAAQVLPRVTKELPKTASNIEQKVDQGSKRVANAVIEFRARTAMVKGMAKAFFLPGLTRPRRVIRGEQKIPVRIEERAAASSEVVREPPVYEEEITVVQSAR